MISWFVRNRATGALVYAYPADEPTNLVEYPLETFNHIREMDEPSVNPSQKITRLAFRNRFTTAEKVALEIAALDNPAATMQERGAAASLRAYMADVNAATFVDLLRPDTRIGVEQLEAFGLLASGRALEILNTPTTAEEAFTE